MVTEHLAVPSRKQCGTCRKRKHSDTTDEQEHIDPRLQLAENASQLMASLPIHSHHRAPLLSALSRDIPSSAAAPLLHASPSYIRDCKRKDVSGSASAAFEVRSGCEATTAQ